MTHVPFSERRKPRTTYEREAERVIAKTHALNQADLAETHITLLRAHLRKALKPHAAPRECQDALRASLRELANEFLEGIKP